MGFVSGIVHCSVFTEEAPVFFAFSETFSAKYGLHCTLL